MSALAPIADAKAVRCRAASNDVMGQKQSSGKPAGPLQLFCEDCVTTCVWRGRVIS
jgi:hypothetical protein